MTFCLAATLHFNINGHPFTLSVNALLAVLQFIISRFAIATAHLQTPETTGAEK
jgi:hypothetical protein